MYVVLQPPAGVWLPAAEGAASGGEPWRRAERSIPPRKGVAPFLPACGAAQEAAAGAAALSAAGTSPAAGAVNGAGAADSPGRETILSLA